MNLVVNSVQSIDGEGTVHLRTEREGELVKITIRDSGRGMTPDQLAKVFDAAFTRKRDRVGLSLGLLITAQIVRDHRGDIRIESTLGEGTTVTFCCHINRIANPASARIRIHYLTIRLMETRHLGDGTVFPRSQISIVG